MTAKLIKLMPNENEVQLILSGSIYNERALYFKQKLLSHLDDNTKSLSLDMSNVRYIDSAGMGALLCVRNTALERGCHFEIKSVGSIVKEIFSINRLNYLLAAENLS
ncbi:STAS domain-containing protein [Selenomonadales bacterium OttesenSCG-928-I06]|nr:STAS domain-containing protein [Selenomonadales bacterium OttesenSCG-928-I06]